MGFTERKRKEREKKRGRDMKCKLRINPGSPLYGNVVTVAVLGEEGIDTVFR